MNVISRQEARASSLSRYYTGLACRRGHIAQRFVSSARCVECNALKCAEWKSKNSDLKKSLDAKYRGANRASHRAYVAEWYQQNRESCIERARVHAAENPGSAKERKRRWKKENPHAATASEATRRARKLGAMPPWFGELDEFVWREAMSLARLRSELTGIPWAADHMVPLAARNACGLHVAANCQVIPSDLNGRKANKLILTDPDEWLQYICPKPKVFASKAK